MLKKGFVTPGDMSFRRGFIYHKRRKNETQDIIFFKRFSFVP